MNRLMRMPTGRPVTRRANPTSPADAAQGDGPVPLDPPPAGAATVRCDQAIFTSIRTPTGEGYRIVAHSPGVSYDERAELTRRSPSHGALASGDAGAHGMLVFALADQRYAVGHCVYAGAEHTARGGQRVWTHYAVLDDATYAAFGFNPIRVQRALAVSGQAGGNPPQALEPLALPAWERVDIAQHLGDAAGAEALIRLMDAYVRGGIWAIAGVPQTPRSVEWALDLLPRAHRRGVSLSCGLAFCLGRNLGVTLVDSIGNGLDRLIRGHNVTLRDVAAECALTAAFAPWYGLIRAWAPAQRWGRISRYTARLTGPLDAEVLARLAQISLDQDVADRADEETKAALRDKYADFTPNGDIEGELLINLRAAIAPPPVPAEQDSHIQDLPPRVRINDGTELT